MTDLSSTILLTVILALSMHRGLTTSNDTTFNTTESQHKDETEMTTKTIPNPPNNYSKSPEIISTTTHKYDNGNITKAAIVAMSHSKSSSASGLINLKTTESSKQNLDINNNQRTLDTTTTTIQPTTNNMMRDTSAISYLGTNYTNVHVSESPFTKETGNDHQTTDNGMTNIPAIESHETTETAYGIKQKTNVTTAISHVNTQTTQPTIKNMMNSSGEGHGNGTDTDGRLKSLFVTFDAGDKLWPVGMALTIAVPTIIVLAITITVLYKRGVAKPRSRMSLYGQKYANM